jgi:Holliday junction resolvase RusA-like endonuclease
MTPRKSPESGKFRPKAQRKGDNRPAPITWHTARCEATSTGWAFALPIPERTNAIWRQWKGRTLVSAKHRLDKALAPTRFGIAEPMRGDVAVRIVWIRQRRAGDIDSRLKAALDLLTAIGVWQDDAQVAALDVRRVDDSTQAPGIYVWVDPLAPEIVRAA